MPKEIKGYLLLIAATIFWGLAGAVAKYFFNQALSPLVLAGVRLTLSALLLMLFLSLRQPALLRLDKADIGKMVLFGLAGMASVQYFCLYTISQLNVATAVFLQYLAPALITIYAVVWNKETLTRPGILALLLHTAVPESRHHGRI